MNKHEQVDSVFVRQNDQNSNQDSIPLSPQSQNAINIHPPKLNEQNPIYKEGDEEEVVPRLNSRANSFINLPQVLDLQEQIEKLKYEEFELIKELSSGAFGRVIVVRHTTADVIIAIKRVPYKSPDKIKMAEDADYYICCCVSNYNYTPEGTGGQFFDQFDCMLQYFI
ncbi:MAG: hypothetical protein EZS28_042654, partial [Streblomastix strix]